MAILHRFERRRLRRREKIDKAALERLCKINGIEVKDSKGKLSIGLDHVLGFLEVLDRRRYEVELVAGVPERFRAASRSRLN